MKSETAASQIPTNATREFFPTEGFSIEWGWAGLRIRAIDYHSTELLLDWDYLRSLAETARGEPPKKVSLCRALSINDVCGKLL